LVPSFLTFFEQLPPERKWSIKGAGKNLLIYRRGKAVNAPNMKSFLDQTSMIASTFFSACGLKKPFGEKAWQLQRGCRPMT
jgi:hypothetical protein